MNWFKRYLLALRKIYVPADDYNKLISLVDKIVRGNKDWTPEELELRQNYSEAVEILLKERMAA